MDERVAAKASVVRPRDLGDAEVDRWRALQSTDRELQNPFLSPAFARAVDAVSHRARVAVFEDGPTIVGFLPFELRAPGIGAPIGIRVNTRQGFVHDPSLLWSWRGVLDATGLDVLELYDAIGPQRRGERTLEPVSAPVIDTAVGWDDYLGRRKKTKTVKTILYKERKLRREHEDVLFRSGPAKDCAELRRLVAWKSQQYRRSGWPDPFARRGVVELLDLLAEDREAGLHAVGSSLHLDGRLVATDLSLTTDTVFSGWFAAHDPELARCSPGAIRTLRTVEAAFDRGVELVDLSRGDESYKDTLKTGDGEVATGYVARPSVRAYAFQAAKVPVTAVRSYVLRHPELRSFVRESLKKVGDTRERLARR
jgi:CelD/BcsL family acetyltransferase involved in cellulose biosynthesis